MRRVRSAVESPPKRGIQADSRRRCHDRGMGADGLIDELTAICGAEHVLVDRDRRRTYESDGLLQYAVVPRAVVLPGSAPEVQRVVAACHAAGVPWVARGAGSGLSGGALPVEEGILVAVTRLRSILEVALANQRVVVEPGVTNLAVSHAV